MALIGHGKSDTQAGAGYEQNQEIKIHLMTATRSKGHEYDAVIILDVDDDEWPNRLTDNIEEERRLFYVAMTRSRKYLYFAVSGGKLESSLFPTKEAAKTSLPKKMILRSHRS